MSAPFDMALFLGGVLTGAHATRKRHLRQARAIQAAIQKNFDLSPPWNWQLKHVRWFRSATCKAKPRQRGITSS